MTQKVTHVKI